MNQEDFRRRVLEAAGARATIITANKRLSRHLTLLYGDACRQQGHSAWLAPNILSLLAWVEQVLVRLGEDYRVLRPTVANRLWEDAVNADAKAHGLELLHVAASARMAMKANQLLADYDSDCSNYPLGEDHRAFLRWQNLFRKACAAGNWVDPAASLDLVETALQQGRFSPPARVLLVGFDELPPRLQRLAAALTARGCQVAEAPPPTAPSGVLTRISCRDAAAEVRAAACWARQLLEGGCRRIGIVVPELDAYRSLIERIFLEEIDPGALLAISDEESRFNLSLGTPLGQQGPVALALSILGCGRELTVEEVSRLLRTPYLGGARHEDESRALCDRFLRSLRRDTFTLTELRSLLHPEGGASSRHPATPRMRTILAALQEFTATRSRVAPGTWAASFTRLLDQVGWPGDRPLDSREFQVVRIWKEVLLAEFTTFDLTTGPMSRDDALALLRRLASEKEFQPEVPDPGIQVCGVLEAGGLEFDHLWVLGLHENAWPPPARPNPFLPVTLQVAAVMPHADAGREAAYTERIMQRLIAAAPEVRFSHPRQEGDWPLRPSPLIAEWPASLDPPAPSHAPQVAIQNAGAVVERVRDEVGPPWSTAEPVPGGTAVLRDQALCPFRAFGHHRLAAQSFGRPVPGIDPAIRGTLAHAVLALFWTLTGSHSALCAMDEEQRRERIRYCVTAALATHYSRFPPAPPAAMRAIEQNRLELLLEDWLMTVEWNRPAFDLVATEHECEDVFGGLRIRTKVDRIDILPDGGKVIIDYKTGRVALDDLVTERLLEPQLPIYAIGAGSEGLAGVAIGQLRRGECTLRGITRDNGLLPRIPAFSGSKLATRHRLANWNELLVRWQTRLEELGRDFMAGQAGVFPVSQEKACRTCDLAPLCRIGEAGDIPAEGEVAP